MSANTEDDRDFLLMSMGYALLALLEVTTHRGEEREAEVQVTRKYRDILRQELTRFEARNKTGG
jgi:hypothetical protein